MNATSAVDVEDLYRAAVGPGRADYYAPEFLRFDEPGSTKISWNWSAFLVASFWFLYRRMYGYWAIYCLLIPFLILVVAGIVSAGAKNPAPLAFANLGLLAYYYVIIPMFANALYHRRIKERIAEVRRKVPDPAVQVTVLENSPHTSAIAWLLVLLLFVPLIGILAAIAIPAYQNYVIRAQVAEGLSLAQPLEAAVAHHYGTDGRWPEGLGDIGVSQAPSGQYVVAVYLDHGTLTITYGNKATPTLAGHSLSLRPVLVSPSRIAWSCGNAPAPAQDAQADAAGPNGTDIADRYLPLACESRAKPAAP
jgi:hypothetical protein